MAKKSSLFEALTGEINHRSFVGLLTIVVLLLHLWLVLLLLQPTEEDKENKPLKVMEVALLSEPSQKAEVASAAPSPPAPPKKVTPKKKAVKPPIKKKEPVIEKRVERPKPEPVKDTIPSAQPSPSDTALKTQTPVSGAQSVVKKPVGKPGNGEAKTNSVSSGVVPLLRVEPKYPMRAASRHIEGWVKIEFTVSPAGSVTNASVVGAQPAGIFDDAALDAIKKWKFKQKIVDGNAVAQRAVQVLKFRLLK